jgi:CubicO group peptidase (beta-lactamase class C family)
MTKKDIYFRELEDKLDQLFQEAVSEKIFPGAALGIRQLSGNKRKIFIKTYGKRSYEENISDPVLESTFYDLASLTKPLATTMSILCLMREGKINLEDKVSNILPEMVSEEKKAITIQDLLSHSSGLPAYRPFFYELAKIEENKKRKKNLLKLIDQAELVYQTGEKSIYSDLGFMLLGMIVEKRSRKSLSAFTLEKIYKPLAVQENIFFAAKRRKKKMDVYAPTEFCPWRKKILVGQVSDENCYILGGVSGHAGIFGNIEGVMKMCGFLLDVWKNKEKMENISSKQLQFFLTRRQEIKNSTWALGFDTPAQEGSSGGKYLSPKSVGHLGFTGTSFWIDPDRELVMVLLSNRVHPSRENGKIKIFRPLFHNTVIEGLDLV